ncbi:hypothetical protein NRI_0541 [Neorickettsia risticii str. Illinois]|uniref:Uncharacterized protein n=1 Tax=Neorickettsia risticii (strain Illinois) TaxID=434131 RepID=C6V553_NEORI|nr:hypothetical protein NRI_0541 [Neorickettsia risticii str. Illinois]
MCFTEFGYQISDQRRVLVLTDVEQSAQIRFVFPLVSIWLL